MKVQTRVTIEMNAEDFDMLSNCSMEFGRTWEDQVNAGRFQDGVVSHYYKHIYWFDNRLSLIMAEGYLNSIGIAFDRAFDTYTDQDVLMTNYVGA